MNWLDEILPKMAAAQLDVVLTQCIEEADIDCKKMADEDPLQQYADNHLDPLYHLSLN